MKKKIQLAHLLDDLRNQDSKRRLHSVQNLKEIATVLGPVRTRTELLQYLSEFIDDEQNIVLELLDQLSDFSQVLGGQQYEKAMLPLLIAFCKTDEKKEAERATQIIQRILKKNKELILDVVKKLAKPQMTTSKQAATKLISSLVDLVPANQAQLIEIYSGMIFSNVSAYRIIGAKYLCSLLAKVRTKEQMEKLIEIIYNETDDLPKILALEALINYYSVNSNIVLSKFKALFVVNNWRINLKICQHVPLAFKIFSKTHFKMTFQSSLIKFLDSSEPQLRAKACSTLKQSASIMNEDEIKRVLIPIVKKLSSDSVDYVKVELSQNIVSLVEVCNGSFLYDEILPIIFNFIKNNDLAVGIIKNFQSMAKKLTPQTLQQRILEPLTKQFQTQNWKVKCKLIQLLGKIMNNQVFLNEKMMSTFVKLVSDRISSVRQKSSVLLISIINRQTSQFTDTMIIPKLARLKNSQNYNERQSLLEIIEKTVDRVSQKALDQFYRPVVMAGLIDQVSNVRAKALKTLKQCKRLYQKPMQKYIDRLRSDQDGQVKQLALAIVMA